MLAGFGTGLGWYAASGFSASEFFLGLHPVWLGMAVNLLAMIVVTLVHSRWRLVAPGRSRQRGVTALALAAVLLLAGVACWPWLSGHGLTGLLLGAVMGTVFVAAVLLTEGAGPSTPAPGTLQPVLARDRRPASSAGMTA
jgi:SSS family solute:Na+ symporter